MVLNEDKKDMAEKDLIPAIISKHLLVVRRVA